MSPSQILPNVWQHLYTLKQNNFKQGDHLGPPKQKYKKKTIQNWKKCSIFLKLSKHQQFERKSKKNNF